MRLLALESTVIAHRLPYPRNPETARELEAVARAHGVEPRTDTTSIAGANKQIGIAIVSAMTWRGLSPKG